jgi:glucan phosphoethanolaminetransferase (alkaline phosphatase superfamily)
MLNVLTGRVRRVPRWTRKSLAILSLAGAAAIVSAKYTHSFLWIFTRETSFIPDLLSTIVAAICLVPLIRNVRLIDQRLDVLSLIVFALFFYIFAAILTIPLGSETVLVRYPMIASVVFAAACMIVKARYVALAAFALTAFLSSINLAHANDMLGPYGFLLVALLLLATVLVVDLRSFFSPTPSRGLPPKNR